MSSAADLPKLYVEGKDDISVINALLSRHGIDTAQGKKVLKIKDQGNIDDVLDSMPEAIKASTSHPVGFVVDIDIKVTDRWNAVRSRLAQLNLSPPATCPPDGYFGQLPDFPHQFGVWLMPDCQTDHTKLENLIKTLLPDNDPLWPHAKDSVTKAERLIDDANNQIAAAEDHWKCFSDVDRIKAEVHTWLAWQREPGVPLGSAINSRFLRHDSPEALKFLEWIMRLYGLA
jgi:hypothetical protein